MRYIGVNKLLIRVHNVLTFERNLFLVREQ